MTQRNEWDEGDGEPRGSDLVRTPGGPPRVLGDDRSEARGITQPQQFVLHVAGDALAEVAQVPQTDPPLAAARRQPRTVARK